GRLDSGTVAWAHHASGDEVHLLHLEYGARSEEEEVRAVTALAERIGTKPLFIKTDFFQQFADSVLTNPDLSINRTGGGEAGAELAHEWVPARNTVMLALALAVAERHGFDVIALGSNMEE